MRFASCIIVLFVSTLAFGQVHNLLDRRKAIAVHQTSDAATMLQKIEKGIERGSVSEFSPFFSSQVYLSFLGQEGYYSSNQTTSVLQNYFQTMKPLSFSFSSYQDKGNNPYATGRLTYALKGTRESAQVYVSLARQESKWVITQFNIY